MRETCSVSFTHNNIENIFQAMPKYHIIKVCTKHTRPSLTIDKGKNICLLSH